jgi:hypothetical protein
MREIVSEIARRTGTEVPIVYGKSWPQSQEEAKTRPDTLIFPLARTAAREPHYQWVQKVLDMDVAFATAPGRPKVETDGAARPLKGIGVRDGSPMVKDLQDRGYTNLVIVKSSAENARALHEGKIEAWSAPAPEVAFNWIELRLPGAPAFGAKTRCRDTALYRRVERHFRDRPREDASGVCLDGARWNTRTYSRSLRIVGPGVMENDAQRDAADRFTAGVGPLSAAADHERYAWIPESAKK